MTDYIEVLTTTETEENAQAIAQALVARRLAACVQIRGPIQSTYRWQGQIETAREWQCVAKTRQSLFPRVETAITELHPYDVPEILAVPIVAASGPYAKWLEEQTASP